MNSDYAASLVGQQFGDYRIEGVLGRGGMGAVLRGRDVNLGRDVALKIIGQEFGGQAGESYTAARDRFLREAKTLAGMAHPNLVHLYAVGETAGKHYFAMELVRGPTLGDWIHRFGPLRDRAAVRFCAQILSALNTVHATGYVHRDIKPGNIMLDCNTALAGPIDPQVPILDQLGGAEVDTGRWVLMDFGLAKLSAESIESSLTQQGLILGTPDTMSPEQAQGFDTTRVSDLYSFGVVLYLALTGKLPFTAPSAMGVMQKHMMEPPPPLTQHWPSAPAVWQEVVAKALEKAPAQRFQCEADFAAALVGRVDDLPELRELARPPRRTANAATGVIGATAAGALPGGPARGESTARIDSRPDTSRGPASARTVSPTDATIRDLPAKLAKPAKPRAPKPAAPGSPAPLAPLAKSAKPAPAAAHSPPLPPPPIRRKLWWLSAAALAVVLLAIGLRCYFQVEPLPPPLAPLPANAFWGVDSAHGNKPVALHWLSLDPTNQTYEVEIYNETTHAWEEQTLTHEQMMQFGDLKKPAPDDLQFPREPAPVE